MKGCGFKAAVPAPNGGYPRTNLGASQPDEDLVASITSAFDSAHNATLRARESNTARPIDSFSEQRYRNMVSSQFSNLPVLHLCRTNFMQSFNH